MRGVQQARQERLNRVYHLMMRELWFARYNKENKDDTNAVYVLNLMVRLFRGVVREEFVFMNDNAPQHQTAAVQNFIEEEGIITLLWPLKFLRHNRQLTCL